MLNIFLSQKYLYLRLPVIVIKNTETIYVYAFFVNNYSSEGT